MTPCRSTDYTHLQSYPGNGGNAGNYGAAINAPFADHTAALRIMGFRRDSPGYVDDTRRGGKPDVNTLEQYGFRGALTWLPADRWTVGLLATTQKTHRSAERRVGKECVDPVSTWWSPDH